MFVMVQAWYLVFHLSVGLFRDVFLVTQWEKRWEWNVKTSESENALKISGCPIQEFPSYFHMYYTVKFPLLNRWVSPQEAGHDKIWSWGNICVVFTRYLTRREKLKQLVTLQVGKHCLFNAPVTPLLILQISMACRTSWKKKTDLVRNFVKSLQI